MPIPPLADGFADFRSDNTGSAAPEIVAAIAAANGGTAAGYGGDRWLEEVQRRFAEVFETPRNAPPRVFPVATGTAANALSLAALTPSWGAVYCSKAAHIETSEANATGFFSGGAKLALLDGEHGKIAPQALEQALASAGVGLAHKSQPAALSLTQATDLGAVYALDEIRALAAIARRYKLSVHMDGARLANALARLGCSPAELTWKAGVDVLSFGVTKNGGLLCDAIVRSTPPWRSAWRSRCAARGRPGRRCASPPRSFWPMSKTGCGSRTRPLPTPPPSASPRASRAYPASPFWRRSKRTRCSLPSTHLSWTGWRKTASVFSTAAKPSRASSAAGIARSKRPAR